MLTTQGREWVLILVPDLQCIGHDIAGKLIHQLGLWFYHPQNKRVGPDSLEFLPEIIFQESLAMSLQSESVIFVR